MASDCIVPEEVCSIIFHKLRTGFTEVVNDGDDDDDNNTVACCLKAGIVK
jgi:hypothetical protein